MARPTKPARKDARGVAMDLMGEGYTIAEVARILRRSRVTVKRWRADARQATHAVAKSSA
jgi:transposase